MLACHVGRESGAIKMSYSGKTEQLDCPVSPIFTPSFIRTGVESGKYILTDLGLEKRCSMCGDYWPADSQFFGMRWSNNEINGLSSGCRACVVESERIRRGLPVPGTGQGVLEL